MRSHNLNWQVLARPARWVSVIDLGHQKEKVLLKPEANSTLATKARDIYIQPTHPFSLNK